MKPEARPRFMTLVTDRMFVLRAVRNQVPLIRRYFFGAFIDRRHPTNRRFNQNQLRRIVMTEFFRVLRKSGGLFFALLTILPTIAGEFPSGSAPIPAFIYAIDSNGTLKWYRHNGSRTGVGVKTPGAWEGPRDIGTGWQNFKKVFSASGGIYAIANNGTLKWYRHNGFNAGDGLETPGVWEGPSDVGTEWQNFKYVFGAVDVIYAIASDGTLKWYKHNGFKTGAGLETPGAWEGPRDVGTGWQNFLGVFARTPAPSEPPH